MDNHTAGNGHASLAICFIMGFLSWVDSYSLSQIAKGASMFISMAAGIMAIRYYYYATKKNK